VNNPNPSVDPLSESVRSMMTTTLVDAGVVKVAEVWLLSDAEVAELFYDFTEQRGL